MESGDQPGPNRESSETLHQTFRDLESEFEGMI